MILNDQKRRASVNPSTPPRTREGSSFPINTPPANERSSQRQSSIYKRVLDDSPETPPAIDKKRRVITVRRLSSEDLKEDSKEEGSPFAVVRVDMVSKLDVPKVLNENGYIEKVKGILNSSSIERNSSHFKLEPFSQGEHVTVFTVRPNLEAASSSSVESLLFNGVSNRDLLVKVYKPKKLREAFSDLVRYPIEQYQKLVEDFGHLPEENRPYVEILNADTARNDGYIVQKKVIPILEGSLKDRTSFLPWEKETKLEDLTPEHRQLLDQVKVLFHYSFLQHPAPGLDLLWQNLGTYEGEETLRIFDYREDETQFCALASGYLDKLGGSPSINDYILEGLEAACAAKGLPEYVYGYFKEVLDGNL
jgi:hypothetical protein